MAAPDLKTPLRARELPVFDNKVDKVARLIGFAQTAGESNGGVDVADSIFQFPVFFYVNTHI